MESKRMAGDYTIILSTTTLTGECVIGENINAKPGFEYMVADYSSNELFGNYENMMKYYSFTVKELQMLQKNFAATEKPLKRNSAIYYRYKNRFVSRYRMRIIYSTKLLLSQRKN